MKLNQEQMKRRKQAIYRANHRGIKEMDIIFGNYANANALEMPDDELEVFEELLEQNDRDLLIWFTGEIPVPEAFNTPLFAKIKHYISTKSR